MNIDGKNILITGGTGSFGRQFVNFVLTHHRPQRVIVFSRDEVKQDEMRKRFPDGPGSQVRYFIGDVRDKERLYRAFNGVDLVVHAAALKQVPTAEYNPLEVIKTNILGAANIIDAAIDRNVAKVVALSSDKAVGPINLYGATKLCADKLFVAAGVYSGAKRSRFCVVRYGNVIGSRGSVIPGFMAQRQAGKLGITDERMTRFWITLDQAVAFVGRSVALMKGGEIFVPKLPSMRVIDLAQAIAPECEIEIVGVRPGEKLHEILINEDEARKTLELDTFFVVQPIPLLDYECKDHLPDWQRVAPDFVYRSDSNNYWLNVEELMAMVAPDGD